MKIYNLPIGITDCDTQSPDPLDLFLAYDRSFCSAVTFPPLKNSDDVVFQCLLIFLLSQWRIFLCIVQLLIFFVQVGKVFVIISDVPWNDIFNLGGVEAASEISK